jgi:hypothetical protein
VKGRASKPLSPLSSIRTPAGLAHLKGPALKYVFRGTDLFVKNIFQKVKITKLHFLSLAGLGTGGLDVECCQCQFFFFK